MKVEIHQPLGDLHPLVGGPAAVVGGQQPGVVAGVGVAVQRLHDGEHLGGVLLVVEQALQGLQRPAPFVVRTFQLQVPAAVGLGAGGARSGGHFA